MFTGIIEQVGEIKNIFKEGSNVHFTVQSEFTSELQVDQSIAHNGVCLTVTSIKDKTYTVTAIQETLNLTNLKNWKKGTLVNLERSLMPTSRMDGHFVQGHVDTTIKFQEVIDQNGSWEYTFNLPKKHLNLVVKKGSVCINGISLTVADCSKTSFKVAIIPYTYEHTNFKALKKEDLVNIEFDIMGKYLQRFLENRTI